MVLYITWVMNICNYSGVIPHSKNIATSGECSWNDRPPALIIDCYLYGCFMTGLANSSFLTEKLWGWGDRGSLETTEVPSNFKFDF